MRASENCIDIIKKWEGLIDGDPNTPGLDPYICPAGVPTIGWGSTWDSKGNPITMDHPPIDLEQAEALLIQELRHTEKAVKKLITFQINQCQFDALVSFTYNVGSGNLQASTLRRKLNRGDTDGAADEFPKWRKAGGRILKGLVRRRAEERDLFLRESP